MKKEVSCLSLLRHKAFTGDATFHSPVAPAQDECEECALLIFKTAIYQYFCVDSESDGSARIDTKAGKTPQNSLPTVFSLMLRRHHQKYTPERDTTQPRKTDNLSDHRLHPPF